MAEESNDHDRNRADQKPDRKEPEGPLGRYARLTPLFAIIAVLGFLGLNYLLADQRGEEISYSVLKEKLAAGEVQKLTISTTKIVAETTETARAAGAPEAWVAVTVDDPTLIELAEDQGVEYEGALSNGMGWILNLLIPFGFLILLWVFLLRRMGGGPAQGVMTFGKSQARLQAEGDTGVTFGDVAGVDEAKEERGRSERRAAGGRRVPEDPGEVRAAGRQDTEGDTARRAARNRQDPTGPGRGR
jgi:cell division protease FtsH